MEQTKKDMVAEMIANAIIEAIQNNHHFADKINDAVTQAVRDTIEVSVDDEVLEAIKDVVDSMTWSNKEEINDALAELLEETPTTLTPQSLKINRQYVHPIDADIFYHLMPATPEELVSHMRFACEDVSFLEHAKRINHMQWILSIL